MIDVERLADLLHETSPDCRLLPTSKQNGPAHRSGDRHWAVVLAARLSAEQPHCCDPLPCHVCEEAGVLGLCIGCQPDCYCARARLSAEPPQVIEGYVNPDGSGKGNWWKA